MQTKREILILLAVVGTLAMVIYGCGKIRPTSPAETDPLEMAPETGSHHDSLLQPPPDPTVTPECAATDLGSQYMQLWEETDSGYSGEDLWPELTRDSDSLFVSARARSEVENNIDLNVPRYSNSFNLPKGSIEDDTTITISIVKCAYWAEGEPPGGRCVYCHGCGPSAEWCYMVEFDFAPDGLQFARGKPANLVIEADWLGVGEGEEVILRYHDRQSGLWKQVSSLVITGETFEFDIAHFSRYAISR
jgi:hypothetical protein